MGQVGENMNKEKAQGMSAVINEIANPLREGYIAITDKGQSFSQLCVELKKTTDLTKKRPLDDKDIGKISRNKKAWQTTRINP